MYNVYYLIISTFAVAKGLQLKPRNQSLNQTFPNPNKEPKALLSEKEETVKRNFDHFDKLYSESENNFTKQVNNTERVHILKHQILGQINKTILSNASVKHSCFNLKKKRHSSLFNSKKYSQHQTNLRSICQTTTEDLSHKNRHKPILMEKDSQNPNYEVAKWTDHDDSIWTLYHTLNKINHQASSTVLDKNISKKQQGSIIQPKDNKFHHAQPGYTQFTYPTRLYTQPSSPTPSYPYQSSYYNAAPNLLNTLAYQPSTGPYQPNIQPEVNNNKIWGTYGLQNGFLNTPSPMPFNTQNSGFQPTNFNLSNNHPSNFTQPNLMTPPSLLFEPNSINQKNNSSLYEGVDSLNKNNNNDNNSQKIINKINESESKIQDNGEQQTNYQNLRNSLPNWGIQRNNTDSNSNGAMEQTRQNNRTYLPAPDQQPDWSLQLKFQPDWDDQLPKLTKEQMKIIVAKTKIQMAEAKLKYIPISSETKEMFDQLLKQQYQQKLKQNIFNARKKKDTVSHIT